MSTVREKTQKWPVLPLQFEASLVCRSLSIILTLFLKQIRGQSAMHAHGMRGLRGGTGVRYASKKRLTQVIIRWKIRRGIAVITLMTIINTNICALHFTRSFIHTCLVLGYSRFCGVAKCWTCDSVSGYFLF